MAIAFNHLQPTEQSACFEFYAHLLQKCTRKAAWHEGKKAHAHLLGSALNANIFLANMLLNMYLRCGNLNEAHMVFENMPVHNACIWTTLISGYVQNRSNKEALVLFERMQQEGFKPDKVTFVCVLNACDNDIHGKQVHAAILLSGSRINTIVRNAVIDMYVQCGNIDHAHQLFLRMRSRDVVSWNIIISGYAHHGDLKEVFSLFNNMQSEGLTPDNVTFVTVLSACGVELLGQGKYFHARIVQFECGLDLFVGSALVNMHSKCGSIGGAMQLFDRMPIRDIVVWNTLFGGYAHYGNVQDMIKLFSQMRQESTKPSIATYLSIIGVCVHVGALQRGRWLHANSLTDLLGSNTKVGSILVEFYANCESMEDALQVFNTMHAHDLWSWSVMIAGYCQLGQDEDALMLFGRMQLEAIDPNQMIFAIVVSACANLAALEKGKQVHTNILKHNYESDIVVASALVQMYANCGEMEDACRVFDGMQDQDIVSWNAIIRCHACQGDALEAYQLFQKVQRGIANPNSITLISLFSACRYAQLVDEAFHQFCVMSQYDATQATPEHYACLTDLLGHVGYFEEAESLVNMISLELDVMAWTSLLGVFSNFKLIGDNNVETSLDKRYITRNWKGSHRLDSVLLFAHSPREENFSYLRVQLLLRMELPFFRGVWSHLVVFNSLYPCKTSLIHGKFMQLEAIDPNQMIFAIVVSACAKLAALKKGKQVHTNILKRIYESDIVIASALVQMYVNCGEMEDACRVFDGMQDQDIVSCNAIIRCHACQGDALEAYQLFQKMQQGVANPNSVTLISLLSACRYAQLVDEALRQLCVMSQYDATQVTAEHYACLIDLLGHVGYFEEAESFVNMTSLELDVMAWTSLLGVCTKQLC